MGAFDAVRFQHNLIEAHRIIAVMRAQIPLHDQILADSRRSIAESRLLLATTLPGEKRRDRPAR